MSFLRNIANIIYSAYCIVVFFFLIFWQMVGFIAVSWMPERRRVLASYRIAQAVSIIWMKVCGYTITIEGAEKVDRTKTYMFVCNHSNFLDLPMTAYFMTFYYKSLAKIELKYIPIFSYLIQRSAVLVDRSSAESRRHSLEVVVSLLRGGLSFLIFPEGTRNKTGKPLKEFFSGAFRMAIMAQVPVQPCVFLDHHRLQPVQGYRFYPGPLRIKVLDAIETTGMKEEDTHILQDKVYRLMEEVIITEDKDFKKTGRNIRIAIRTNEVTELVINDDCEFADFYSFTGYLARVLCVEYSRKIDDLDSLWWDFDCLGYELTVHYNIYLGISIYHKRGGIISEQESKILDHIREILTAI